MPQLSDLEVLIVDCQATGAAPAGHLIEIGWARVRTTAARVESRLVRLPNGAGIPPAVTRVTGINHRVMRDAVDASVAARELAQAAGHLDQQPTPTVIHFARFEQPFLERLTEESRVFDIVCTHAIACRLLPDLPRRGLRALTGYFGRGVGILRRSADHVDATAFVWRELVRLLDAEGVSTWADLRAWLSAPVRARRRVRRVWPMPRATRLAVPDVPGLYRFLRSSGDVLYVGKAASLHHRVNSYFQHQHGVSERMLEMLSQVRAVSFDVAPTALEAALLEPDEIKRHRPPYNIALTDDPERRLWFSPPDLSERCGRPTSRCSVGPFPSAETLDQFAALMHAHPRAVARDRWAPDTATFSAGCTRFRTAHPELSRAGFDAQQLLAVGTRLWREGRRDREADEDAGAAPIGAPAWTPELVQRALEDVVLRAALARRRASWFCRLMNAAVMWREPGATDFQLIVFDNGEITTRVTVGENATPPVPPGDGRTRAVCQQAMTVARFDRLRVLTTELKRLATSGAAFTVRWGVQRPVDAARLAVALSWV